MKSGKRESEVEGRGRDSTPHKRCIAIVLPLLIILLLFKMVINIIDIFKKYI